MPVSLTPILSTLPAAADKQQPPSPSPRTTTPLEARGKAMLYAAKWPAARDHARNTEAYYHAAALRKDFALLESDAWEILRDWNATNTPPLEDEELRQILSNANQYGKHTPGAKLDAPPNKITVIDAATWLVTDPPAVDQILADTFDRGDKAGIIGALKVRKSFFCQQMMLSIASGRDFLHWSVPRARRVFAVQFEIQPHHFHRRLKRMALAMGIAPADLEDRLQVVNARGMGLAGVGGVRAILDATLPYRPDVIFLDPLYKIASGIENAAEDLKVILNAFDELAVATGAAIVYVHHDAKGFSGDRDIRDRGAGSNVLGRDYDACMALTPHASEEDTMVVETLPRNYRPQEPVTVAWMEDPATGGYFFCSRFDIAPTKQTSTTARKQSATPLPELQPVALEVLSSGPLAISEFKARVRTKSGISRDRADEFAKWMLLKAEPTLDVYESRGKGVHTKYIGTAAQIQALKESDNV